MSLKRLAVLAAVQTDGYIINNNMTSFTGARAGPSLHGNVNVLLSGAMLSGLILVVFLICYCCHRNMSKNSGGRGTQYWQEEPEVPLEVFTVDGQCYEVAGVFLPPDSLDPPAPSPPPAYETVIACSSPQKKEEDEDDSGLPTYEAALRLEAQGYV